MYYTQEQIDRANQINLVDWLRGQGESLEKSGKDFRWKRHDSVTIRGNRWFRHSQQTGGYPVDFVKEFFGCTFPEAVELLIGEKPESDSPQLEYQTTVKSTTENPESTVVLKKTTCDEQEEFHLPPANETSDNLRRYLTEVRCIAPEIVESFLSSGSIYEDAKHHNVIFVGKDENGVTCYGHAKGTTGNFRQDLKDSDKRFGFRYEGTDKTVFVFEAPVDMLSFISLHPKDWEQHSYLSLGGVSDKALVEYLNRRKDIEQIFLCLDNDVAGITATKKIASTIGQQYQIYSFRPVKKDWNELLQHRDEIDGKLYEKLVFDHANHVTMMKMSDVESQAVQWLWKPFIPFGKVTIIQGNPGEGKTTLVLRLAAACTNHKLFPGMDDLEPFNVIYQTAEDGLGDTVKPRLIEAGADLTKVLVIDESEEQLSFSDSRIERAIIQNRAKLLILDPMQAYVGEKTDMNRANEVRPLFRKLADIADRTGCAIVLIGHLNKASGGQSAYRGLGSIDFRAAARSVLLIGRVRKEPNVRVIIHDKSSLAPEGKPMAFSLGDENGFEWIGEYDITADDLLSGKGGDTETKQEIAKQLILDLLASGERVLSDDIEKAAGELGISERTVRIAKNILRDDANVNLKSQRIAGRWYHWIEK